MKLPKLEPSVHRYSTGNVQPVDLSQGGIFPSRNKNVTGMAVCRKGSGVLWTASETICTNPDHAGCTTAKNAAVQAYADQCRTDGGTISHSGSPCTYGDKC